MSVLIDGAERENSGFHFKGCAWTTCAWGKWENIKWPTLHIANHLRILSLGHIIHESHLFVDRAIRPGGELKKEKGDISILGLYGLKSESHISKVQVPSNASLSKNDFGVQVNGLDAEFLSVTFYLNWSAVIAMTTKINNSPFPGLFFPYFLSETNQFALKELTEMWGRVGESEKEERSKREGEQDIQEKRKASRLLDHFFYFLYFSSWVFLPSTQAIQ